MDLTRIDGIDVTTALAVISGRTKRCANRAAQALRLAAAALRTSKSALGAYFRRMCSRMEKAKAVTYSVPLRDWTGNKELKG